MAILTTIAKGFKVAQVVTANTVAQVEVAPRTLEELNEVQGIKRRGKCSSSKQLDLSHLEG